MCNSIDNSTSPPSPFCLVCCQKPFCCKKGKTTGFTFFLQAPFPPGTASHSLLMASLIGGVRKYQKSKSVTQILQVYVFEPKKKSTQVKHDDKLCVSTSGSGERSRICHSSKVKKGFPAGLYLEDEVCMVRLVTKDIK